MKKVLIVAAKANMIRQFNQHNILILQELGFEVHVGTNFKEFGSMDNQENDKLIQWLKEHDVTSHQIDFGRKLGSFKANFVVIKQLRAIMKDKNEWAFMHAHSPIGSVLGRIAAKSQGVKTMYTSHGFHFFKGGPKKNWLVFPIEWLLGFITDQLIVINSNDLKIADYLPIENVEYIPSVGIDVKKMMAITSEERASMRNEKRAELGLKPDDFVLLHVGELSNLKNQRIVIEAMGKINNPNLKFMIAGVGPNHDEYLALAKELGLENQLKLLGYRNDIQALHFAADLFVFPSRREGFGLGGFEALVDGLKVIGTKNTGMKDFIIGPAYGELIDTTNVDAVTNAIATVMAHPEKPGVGMDKNFIETFDSSNVDRIMKSIYSKFK
ncbi:glycosyltransferase [Periweissella ghanensis]|uniref:Glycosyltransferase EpsD n=1 Tax=Periweissella ghanensis TaxID=467997 RepID=A0ABM8ZC92_9LACO|nr:glycosyltransferase [Periweissella ghanensis]MCM0600229.1 glycosyltransferase [Periweissella ghanensis]CAH0419139.1 Putative glycosyltransferase EpsD [Periweissella ghanensis]